MLSTGSKIFGKLLAPLFLVFTTVSFWGCDTALFHPRLKEGAIEYEVTYPVMDPDNVMADFMPKTMTLEFKDDKFKTELSAGMGMFKTNFIGDCKTHQMHHLVKMVNKKYVTEYNDESVGVLNKAYDDFTILETIDTKVIAGYECKKIWVIYTDVSMPSFELYYTEDIQIKDPNWSLPFIDIDGVLMQYDMKRNGIIMRLTAIKVDKTEIADETFLVPEEYEKVTIDEMESELDKLFETFNY